MRSCHQATGRAASAALALVLFTLAALPSTAGFVTHQSSQRVARATVLHDAFAQARFSLSTELAHVHAYITTRDPRARAAFHSADADLRASLDLVRHGGEPELRAAVPGLLTEHESLVAAAARAFAAADVPGAPEDEIHAQMESDPALARLRGSLEAWVEIQEAQVGATVLELERITLVLWLGTPVAFLVGVAILYQVWSRIQAQQRALHDSARRELEASRRAERRVTSLLANVSDIIVLLGPDGLAEYESPSAEALLGYRPGALPNQASLEFIHPEDRRRARAVVAQAIATPGREVRDEIRFWHADGTWRDYVVVGRSLLDQPEIRGIILTCHDITERRQAERALADRENRLSEAQRLAQLGSWDWDIAGNKLTWSEEHYRIFGLEPFASVPIYETFMAAVHPDDVDRLRSLIKATLAGDQPFDTRIQIIRPDGEVRIIHSRGAVRRDGTGRPTQLVGTVQDVTERHHIERALQESERSLQALVGSLDDIVFEFDGEGTYVNIWARDEALLARPRESLLGQRVTDVLGDEVGRPYLQIFKRVLRTGQSEQLEYALDVGAGTRWFLASISPIPLPNGEFRTVSMLSRDITERKRVEAELLQAQRLESVGRLAAGIAHEINTPIQFIGDNVQFLRTSFASLERVTGVVRTSLQVAEGSSDGAIADRALRDDLREVAAEADLDYLTDEIPLAIEQTLDGIEQVASIVRAMKEFAHPEGNERVAVDLNRALASTLTVARNELKYLADIEAEYADLPPVPCHPSAINQVFLNLLVNAAHAIADRGEADRGTIRVRTARDGDEAVVEIADTGCGIPDRIKSKIFDQFFTTKEVGRGTGQGLALARRIVVEQHGGVLSFETEVGRGTSFYVRLPLEVRSPARACDVLLASR